MAEESKKQVQDGTEKKVREGQVDNTLKIQDSTYTHRSRSGFWLGIVIMLTVIALAGVGFFLFQQIRDVEQDLGGEINKDEAQLAALTEQITGYQKQLVAIQAQLADLNSEITGKEAFFNNKLEDFSKLHHEKLQTAKSTISNSVLQIQRQLGKTRGDWLIADAEYLLSIANQRLHLMGDVKTTEEALQASDQRLRESGDAAVYKVRQQLANEMAQLKGIRLPDIVGIYAKIQILSENVAKLTLFLPFHGKGLTKPDEAAQETSNPEQAESPDELQEMLDAAFEELGDLVTIRRTDMPIKSVLTAEEAYFIQQQLQVKLEMVKIALVQRNDPLYKEGLADTKHWVQDNFLQNEVAKNYISELDRLSTINLRSQFPDISKSLKMLRDVTKLRLETDKGLESSPPSAPVSDLNESLLTPQSPPEKATPDVEQATPEANEAAASEPESSAVSKE